MFQGLREMLKRVQHDIRLYMRCPGQDKQFWKPEDIYDVECPKCKAKVEFWKDDVYRRCSKCGYRFRNPKLDLGCAEWCPYASQCLGQDTEKIKD